MCRGYLRREAERARPQRLVAAILLNAHRSSRDHAVAPEDIFYLYGDLPPAPPMDEETFEATMARLAEFDTLSPAA